MFVWLVVVGANLAMVLLLGRQLVRRVPSELGWSVCASCAGAALGVLIALLEIKIFAWEYLALGAQERGFGTALLGALLVAAPLEEAAKYAAMWPLSRRHRLRTRASGVFFAIAVAAGFTVGEAFGWFWWSAPETHLYQWLLTTPAQAFCTGLWGYVLASRVHSGRFRWAWLGATVIHGFFDFIVFGLGAELWPAALPLLLSMILIASRALDKVSRGAADDTVRFLAALSAPSARAVRQVMRQGADALRLRWVLVAGLVTLGMLMLAVFAGLYLSHRLGMDFEHLERGELRANGPLGVLGGCALGAFPLAGYLVAEASAAKSVVESALGASFAILAIALAFSLAAPVAAVFVIAVAPVAFGLTCGGAWFALER